MRCSCTCRLALLAVWVCFLCGPVAAGQQASPKCDSLRLAVADLRAQLTRLEQQLTELDTEESQAAWAETPSLAGADLLAGRGNAVYLPGREETRPNPLPITSEPAGTSLLEQSRVEITGYLDAVCEIHPQERSENQVGLNQVDIDISRSLGDRAEAFVCLWYDEVFVVGAATISYALRTPPAEEDERRSVLSEWTVTGGQFDIPVGLEYLRYASIHRPTVTQPDAWIATHDTWNDAGLLTTLGSRWGSLDLYVVQGWESRVWNSDDELPVDVANDDERWLVLQPQISTGARFHLQPTEGFGWGGSLARGWTKENESVNTLWGVHAQGSWRGLSCRAEALTHRPIWTDSESEVRGYYVEAMQEIGRFYAVGRLDEVEGESDLAGRFWSLGGGVTLVEGLQCRSQYRFSDEESREGLLLQVAAGF